MAELEHYGVARRSGRYPWGSGKDPYQNSMNFLSYVHDLRSKGFSDAEIVKEAGLRSQGELRDRITIANAEKKAADIAMINRLKEKGYSNTAIGKRMGINESTVRSLLKQAENPKIDVVKNTAEKLKNRVDNDGVYVDIGAGSDRRLGISAERLRSAVRTLEDQGYVTHNIPVEQQGTRGGEITQVKILCPPGTEWKTAVNSKEKIALADFYTENRGKDIEIIRPPVSFDSKRLAVRYASEGGADADGLIELRRGVEDISLGNAKYAQVRILVDNDYYIKGMAAYSDNIPKGVDMVFNTNKEKTGSKLDALKKVKDDPENPFGSVVRQKTYIDKDGKKQITVHNIVYEEGTWDTWNRTLSSQFLSKQNNAVIKEQLHKARMDKETEFAEIRELTNPAVKRALLDKFADSADSAAVYLKAAAMPRQATQVLIPLRDIKDNEIYAPRFNQGEKVVLVRHPHGGIFEIPELTVNNRNVEGKKVIGSDAIDAVGINSKVASQLSGADFDGDTVLVIPNNSNVIKHTRPLEKLKDFDPRAAYPKFEGMPKMTDRQKQQEMGKVSNLITDMTIKGAIEEELVKAVRHSMVVIDAEKHELNYKQSAIDNEIPALKKKYQSGGGAATLISRANSPMLVPHRTTRSMAEGGPINTRTGELVYVPTGKTTVNRKGETIPKTTKSTKMAEAKDARSLSSGTVTEELYAAHANSMKAMANQARLEAYRTKSIPYSPAAKKAYATEVASLKTKLDTALQNAPLERQAQILAESKVRAIKKADPSIKEDQDKLRKFKGAALAEARVKVGAGKTNIKIEPSEWAAIQAGAISNSALEAIIRNADLDTLKTLATPRSSTGVTQAQHGRIKAMLAAGYTISEVADAVGVSASTVGKVANPRKD